jgi:hypothetical protein
MVMWASDSMQPWATARPTPDEPPMIRTHLFRGLEVKIRASDMVRCGDGGLGKCGNVVSTHEGEVRVLELVHYLDSMLQTKSMVRVQ